MSNNTLAASRVLANHLRKLAMTIFNQRVIQVDLQGAILEKNGQLDPEDSVDFVIYLPGSPEGTDAQATQIFNDVLQHNLQSVPATGPLSFVDFPVQVTIKRLPIM